MLFGTVCFYQWSWKLNYKCSLMCLSIVRHFRSSDFCHVTYNWELTVKLDRLSVRGRPSICSSIEQFAVTIANQKSFFSFLTKQPPMRVSQSNAANKRGNWHILRQVYISGRIYRKNSRKFDLDQIWDRLDHLQTVYSRSAQRWLLI